MSVSNWADKIAAGRAQRTDGVPQTDWASKIAAGRASRQQGNNRKQQVREQSGMDALRTDVKNTLNKNKTMQNPDRSGALRMETADMARSVAQQRKWLNRYANEFSQEEYSALDGELAGYETALAAYGDRLRMGAQSRERQKDVALGEMQQKAALRDAGIEPVGTGNKWYQEGKRRAGTLPQGKIQQSSPEVPTTTDAEPWYAEGVRGSATLPKSTLRQERDARVDGAILAGAAQDAGKQENAADGNAKLLKALGAAIAEVDAEMEQLTKQAARNASGQLYRQADIDALAQLRKERQGYVEQVQRVWKALNDAAQGGTQARNALLHAYEAAQGAYSQDGRYAKQADALIMKMAIRRAVGRQDEEQAATAADMIQAVKGTVESRRAEQYMRRFAQSGYDLAALVKTSQDEYAAAQGASDKAASVTNELATYHDINREYLTPLTKEDGTPYGENDARQAAEVEAFLKKHGEALTAEQTGAENAWALRAEADRMGRSLYARSAEARQAAELPEDGGLSVVYTYANQIRAAENREGSGEITRHEASAQASKEAGDEAVRQVGAALLYLRSQADFAEKSAKNDFGVGAQLLGNQFDDLSDGDKIKLFLNGGAALSRSSTMPTDREDIPQWACFADVSDDERAMLNYLFNTLGDKQALAYAEMIRPLCLERYANRLAKKVDYPVLRELRAFGYGVERWMEGAADIFVNTPTDPTSDDYAMQGLYQRNKDNVLAKYGMMAAQNIGQNIVPHAIGVVTGTPWLGAASMGVSAAGNAKQEGLRAGMSVEQANLYGVGVGLAETMTEKLLGGIPGVGDNNLGTFLAGKVSNIYGKALLNLSGRVISELSEEELQNWIEPGIKWAVSAFGKQKFDFEAPSGEEALDTAVTTVLTTLILGAGAVRGEIKTAQFDDSVRQTVDAILASEQTEQDSGARQVAEALKKRMDRDETITPELFRAEIAKAGEEALRAFAATAEKNEQVNIDNAENSGYTGENGGVSSDGNRMDRGVAEGVPGHEDVSGNAPAGRAGGSTEDGRTSQVLSRRAVSQSVQNAFTESGVVAAELQNFDADSAAFSSALEAARTADADHGWAVTPQTAEDLQGKRTFMNEGGTIGFALTDDGDIEAVFKNKQLNHTRFAMDGVMPQAIAAGGVKLDCYGEALVNFYERYGFTPVARVEFNEQYANDGWDASKGTPYIYFMVHNGDSAETVAANIGKYPHMERSQLESLPTYGKEGYDQAAAYRDGLLTRRGVHGALDGGSSVATAQTQAQQIAQRKSDTVSAQTENAPETQKAASGGNDVSASARQTDRMGRDDFAVQFRKGQKNASELDVDLAYQDYLEGAATEGNSAAGLVQNERSVQLTKKEADAIDALGKLFGRRFVMDDLGENNGIWNEEGDIRIDIAPRHNGAKNVFLFTAEHEIGHEVRSRIGTLAWKRLEDAVITIKGSDAVAEKQASDEAYAKESAAREDVTCDFIGELLSDKETLDAFLRSIRNGEQVKNLRGIRALISAAKSFFGRLAGRGSRNANAEVLVRKVQEQFGADIASARRAVSELQQAVTEAVSARRDGDRTEKFSKKENREERYDETAAYRNEPLARREQAESTLEDDGTDASEATGRGRRKITQDDVNVSVLENENGYSADIGGEKFDFIWKQNLDGEGRTLYNKSGERSAQLTDVIRRLHTGETVPVEEVMRLPEVELVSALSEAEETIRLPDRTELRNAGYEDAMRLGSYNSETGKLDGEILRERRMDIVIGLPGSGKSSVYSHRLSEEYGERIIDTDDFRSYIPEYNGMNSPVVHREASLMRDMVLDEALNRGENILLSTVGANAKSLAGKIQKYKALGYSVYLHLNELPYLESVARVLERYVGKDGKLGRIVMPDRVYRDKGAPTQAYLEVTGQEGYYETFKVDGDVSGSREMGGSARARNAGSLNSEKEGARRGGESGAREGSERKGENDVSDLLSGFDWRNNDVAHGEAPVVVQADRASEIDRTAVKRYSKKDSAHKVTPQLERRNEETNAEIQTVGQLVRSVERAEQRAAISEEIAHETLAKTDAAIAEQTAERPKIPSVIPSKAEAERIAQRHEDTIQRQRSDSALRRIAKEAKRQQRTADEVEMYRQAERAERKAEKVKARYDERIDGLLKKLGLAERKSEVEEALRKDAEKQSEEVLRWALKSEERAEKARARSDQRNERTEAALRHEKRQSGLEKALRKDAEKDIRTLKSLIEQRNAKIHRLQLDALLNTQDGKKAAAAIRNWRAKGNLGSAALSGDEIDTAILTLKEQREISSAPKKVTEWLSDAGKKLAFYFTSDVLPFEEIGRLQSRTDSIDTRVTMFKNAKSTANAILTEQLRAPDGTVLDGRSLRDILGCWKDGKVGGKIDEARQRLLDRYLYMKHSADRMGMEEKARSVMRAFLEKHPDYKQYAAIVQKDDGTVSEIKLTKKVADVVEAAANGDEVAAEYITLAQAFANAKNKPVFGAKDGRALNAETSEMIARQIEEANPWVKKKAEEYYAWWDKFMRAWYVGVQGSQEQYDAMRKMYPHYVPTYRALKKQGSVWGFSPNGLNERSVIRSAKGSTLDLNTVGDNVARQIESLVKATRMSELFANLYEETLNGTEGVENYAVLPYDRERTQQALAAERADVYSDETLPDDESLANGTFFKDGDGYAWNGYFSGERRTLRISKRMFESLRSLTNTGEAFLNKAAAVGSKVTAPMKTAITGINPSFAIRNVVRDFTTALVNSIAGLGFIKYYGMAYAKIFGQSKAAMNVTELMLKLSNGSISETERASLAERALEAVRSAQVKGSKEWNDFVALGGTGATKARSETGFLWNKDAKGKISGAWEGTKNALGTINELTESVTRFAEYLATIEKYGDTAEGRARGIKNAAEVTVDFSRHGKVGRLINAWSPYWNPGIQGISKMYRSIRFPGEGNAISKTDAWKLRGKVLARGSLAIGIAPRLLQFGIIALLGKRDEWDELTDRAKDTYFVIPTKDGKFVKIPYNRDWGQLFGSTFSRIVQGAQGREDNWRDFWDGVIEGNFSIMPNVIGVTQLLELAKNEDFAGRAIVPYSMENIETSEQYDADTSWLAKQLGKLDVMQAIGLSPVEIDYLISSYFGDYGDMLIEATDADGITGLRNFFTDVLGKSFKADSAYSSLTMSRYYDLKDDLETKIATEKYKDPEGYKQSIEYQISTALDSSYGEQIRELGKLAREAKDEDEKRALKFQMQQVAKQALDFYERCMDGETDDPVRYLKYEPYGDRVRDELIALSEFEDSEKYDYLYTPRATAPKIGDHVNSDEEKERYAEIYVDNYTQFATNIIESRQYDAASLEEKAILLEGARELAAFYSKKEWATEFKLKAENKYGKVTYDPAAATTQAFEMFENKLPAATVSEILHGVAELEPEGGKESVSALQKWEYVVSVNGLTGAQQDAALRAYMTEEQQSKYEPVAAAGVSAKTYVATTRRIADLQPIRDNTKVSDVQKWQVCIAATKSQEQQDALLRSYMDKEQIAKYNELRKAGVSPATYVAYADAKYTYGDGNGSWKQDELREWLNEQDLTREQKAAIWETTNSGWKTNPYR